MMRTTTRSRIPILSRRITALALVAAFLFAALPARAVTLDTPVLADCAVLGEVETGLTLYEHNAETVRNPDALTKIMTLLLAAEASERETGAISRNTRVTVSNSAVADLPSRADKTGLSPGETLTYLDLLMCMFLGGGADASNVVAERVAGSVDAFVEEMNARAYELGCVNTVFTDAHGQGSAQQQTTAYDLFLIAREAAKHDLFLEVAGTERYTVPATNYAAERSIVGTNYITSSTRQRYYYRFALAGRVSATYENGYGSVEIAERGGMRVVSVILGAKAVIEDDGYTQTQNLSEAKRLFEWGFANFGWRTLLPGIVPITHVPVKYGNGADFVNLRPEREVTLLLSLDVADADVEREIILYAEQKGEDVAAPVRAGDALGEIVLSHGGKELARIKLLADTSVDLLRIAMVRDQVLGALRGKWMLLALIIVALLFITYVALVVRYRKLRRKRKEELARRKREIAEQRKSGGHDYE